MPSGPGLPPAGFVFAGLNRRTRQGCIIADILNEDDVTQSIHGLRVPLRRGDRLAGRFVIVQFLARGGMGEVYEASDEHLQGKHCALKTLRPEIAVDPEMQQRFEREVLLAREVNHPNVCPTFDIFHTDEPDRPRLFLTMKLLRGESLATRLSRLEKLTADVTLTIARQMAAGLDAAHKAGVIHRDFKPGNVMLEGTGSDVRVSITDFGLSRLYESDGTVAQSGRLSGTIGYIAPELLRGGVTTPAADVYAFGVVLHEMLTGQKPENKSGKLARKAPSSAVDGLPRVWDRVVRGCLEYDPARRFQSAGEALALLEQASSASRPAEVRRPITRRLAMGAGGATLAGGALWLSWPLLERRLHPLPDRRVVALMPWPELQEASAAPLLRLAMDAIGARLVRAEATLPGFAVTSPADAGVVRPKTLGDALTLLGANLVLGLELRNQAAGYRLALRVLEPVTGAVLRQRDLLVAAAQVSLLAERASAAAAELLDVPQTVSRLKDADELARLPAGAVRMFGEAEDLRAQPNDSGLDAAIERYQQVLEASPRFAVGYASLSQAYTRKFQKTHDRALLSLAEENARLALQYNPDSSQGVFAAAMVDVFSGKAQDGLKGLSQGLRLDPGNQQMLLFQARALRDLGRSAEEEAIYQEILRLRPNFWRAHNELGYFYYRQHDYRKAADAFAEAAAAAPRVALPLNNQGAMLLSLEDSKGAEECFRRSLERAPTELAYSNLGTMRFQQKDYQGAAGLYEKALGINPKSADRWRDLGDCYTMLGDRKREQECFGKAADLLGEMQRINSQQVSDRVRLAFYQAKAGRRAEAEAAIRAAKQQGIDKESRFWLAQALAVLGHKQEALQTILKCLDEGISSARVGLALDLREVLTDPRYRRRSAENGPPK